MTILDPSPRPGHDGRDVAKPDPRAGTLILPSRPGTIPLPPRPGTITLPPRLGTLTAGGLKVTLVVNAAELRRQRVTLRIRLPDRTPPGTRPSRCPKRRQRSAKPAQTTSRSCCYAAGVGTTSRRK